MEIFTIILLYSAQELVKLVVVAYSFTTAEILYTTVTSGGATTFTTPITPTYSRLGPRVRDSFIDGRVRGSAY